MAKQSTKEIISDLSSKVAGDLIAMIESAEIDPSTWSKPWAALVAGGHHNPIAQVRTTGKGKDEKPSFDEEGFVKVGDPTVYKGINTLILAVYAHDRGYESTRWATFNQIRKAGGSVVNAKGMGVRLMYWGRVNKCSEHKAPYKGKCCPAMTTFMFGKTFTVFNEEHWQGVKARDLTEGMVAPEPDETIDKFLAESGASIAHKAQDRAYYTPGTNNIVLPKREQFDTANGYYATALHELVHWTGNDNRLNRAQRNQFGTPDYAREELCAEMGSAMLMAHFGREAEPSVEHATYLKGWLQAIKDDPTVIYKAAQAAQKAVAFLTGSVTAEGERKVA